VIFSRRAGFTLLEICLALAIGVMLILLAVPSISGLLAEQRLKQSFERFDQLVAAAKLKSVTEQRTYALAWDRKGIGLRALGANESGNDEDAGDRLVFEKDESFDLTRPGALLKDAPSVWVFWRNGTCEPARISFHGKAGSWLVSYDPLTARGTFLNSNVP
jgi:type II secretory pathway pseudopilin PulG